MVSGNFADLLIILSDSEKEPIPRGFFLDYDIIKNRNGTYAIMKKDRTIFYITPTWLADIMYEFEIQGENKIREEIKKTLGIE